MNKQLFGKLVESMTQMENIMFGIGRAVKELQDGHKVTRSGWNGRNMYLALQLPDANSKLSLPYVYMRTVDGKLVPWVCSQTDLLAVDWGLFIDVLG